MVVEQRIPAEIGKNQSHQFQWLVRTFLVGHVQTNPTKDGAFDSVRQPHQTTGWGNGSRGECRYTELMNFPSGFFSELLCQKLAGFSYTHLLYVYHMCKICVVFHMFHIFYTCFFCNAGCLVFPTMLTRLATIGAVSPISFFVTRAELRLIASSWGKVTCLSMRMVEGYQAEVLSCDACFIFVLCMLCFANFELKTEVRHSGTAIWLAGAYMRGYGLPGVHMYLCTMGVQFWYKGHHVLQYNRSMDGPLARPSQNCLRENVRRPRRTGSCPKMSQKPATDFNIMCQFDLCIYSVFCQKLCYDSLWHYDDVWILVLWLQVDEQGPRSNRASAMEAKSV